MRNAGYESAARAVPGCSVRGAVVGVVVVAVVVVVVVLVVVLVAVVVKVVEVVEDGDVFWWLLVLYLLVTEVQH